MKSKVLKFVLPFLLDSYVAVMDKKLSDGKLKYPGAWIISRDLSIRLSKLIKNS